MKFNKNSFFLFCSLFIFFPGIFLFKKLTAQYSKVTTTHTSTKTIKVNGFMRVKDEMRIGSVIEGVVYKMYVNENDMVKKGQLLVEIDDGRLDTLVKEALAQLQKAKAIETYQKEFFNRQKILFEKNYISLDEFQQAQRDLHVAEYEVALRQASLEEEQTLYSRKFIKAPEDGIVVSQIAREGETVTLSSPPTLLYVLARNLKQMKVALEIHEDQIARVKEKTSVTLMSDAYPHQTFTGQITKISNRPKQNGDSVVYIALVPFDNSEMLFRPGMQVTAQISVR